MKYLLFEGSSNVGKTCAIVRFSHNLVNNHGYVCLVGKLPPLGSKNDFQAILENPNGKKDRKRIIVNSASDTIDIIDDAQKFAKSNVPYDVVVSSCREESYLYNHFFKVFSITNMDTVFEIPMAKINHRNASYKRHGMKWFKDKVDILADFLFQQL